MSFCFACHGWYMPPCDCQPGPGGTGDGAMPRCWLDSLGDPRSLFAEAVDTSSSSQPTPLLLIPSPRRLSLCLNREGRALAGSRALAAPGAFFLCKQRSSRPSRAKVASAFGGAVRIGEMFVAVSLTSRRGCLGEDRRDAGARAAPKPDGAWRRSLGAAGCCRLPRRSASLPFAGERGSCFAKAAGKDRTASGSLRESACPSHSAWM